MFQFLIILMLIASCIEQSYQYQHLPNLYTRSMSRKTYQQRYQRKPIFMNSDSSTTPSTEKAARDTIPFEIRGFSLPLVIFTVGILVTASSFVGKFVPTSLVIT